jgi:altronate dehydratase
LVEGYQLDRSRYPRLIIQELGGSLKTIEAGIAAVEQLLPEVNQARRTPQPLSGLTLALQCGGSDGWSGVTANPLVGQVSDEIVRQGGAVVLAETTEVYGAEHLLVQRAASREVADKLLAHIAWWQAHAEEAGMVLDNNRGVGNEAGGLTTIYEKSLGGIAKAGSSPLVDVVDYAQAVTSPGLTFMDTPGNDPIAVTGQMAGGCNLVLFTTGRGSVAGFKPAPSIKIASNSELFRRLPDDMDVNAGRVLEGESLEQVGADLLDLVVAVASGQPTKSESLGAGEAEFVPWTLGANL